LIEVLVGAPILAAGAVIVCGLGRRCIVNIVRGGHYELAYLLLDECLDRVATAGVGQLAGQKSIEERRIAAVSEFGQPGGQ